MLGRMMAKVMKNMKVVQKEETKKGENNIKVKEYLCLLIKSLEDSFKKVATPRELGEIILEMRGAIIETICTTSECDDIMIRN